MFLTAISGTFMLSSFLNELNFSDAPAPSPDEGEAVFAAAGGLGGGGLALCMDAGGGGGGNPLGDELIDSGDLGGAFIPGLGNVIVFGI